VILETVEVLNKRWISFLFGKSSKKSKKRIGGGKIGIFFFMKPVFNERIGKEGDSM
jgi:hypothetical protein